MFLRCKGTIFRRTIQIFLRKNQFFARKVRDLGKLQSPDFNNQNAEKWSETGIDMIVISGKCCEIMGRNADFVRVMLRYWPKITIFAPQKNKKLIGVCVFRDCGTCYYRYCVYGSDSPPSFCRIQMNGPAHTPPGMGSVCDV